MKNGTAILVMNESTSVELFITRPIGVNKLDPNKDWLILTRSEYKTAIANAEDPYGAAIDRAFWGAVMGTAVKEKVITDKDNPQLGEVGKTIARSVIQKSIKDKLKELKAQFKPVNRAKKFREPPKVPVVTVSHALASLYEEAAVKDPLLAEMKILYISEHAKKTEWKTKYLSETPYETVINDVTEGKQKPVPWLHGFAPNQIRGAVMRRLLVDAGVPPPPSTPAPSTSSTGTTTTTTVTATVATPTTWEESLDKAKAAELEVTIPADDVLIASYKSKLEILNKEIPEYTSAAEQYLIDAREEADKRKRAYEAKAGI